MGTINLELKISAKNIESKLKPINKKFTAFITSLKIQCAFESNLRLLKCTIAILKLRF